MLHAAKKKYAKLPRKKYLVDVKRKSIRVLRIKVKARDLQEAKDLALGAAPSEDFAEGDEKEVDYEAGTISLM